MAWVPGTMATSVCCAMPSRPWAARAAFLVPNPGQGTPLPPENPMFRLVPNRFGKRNVVPSFETQYGPIREVRFQYRPDGSRDSSVHQLWVVTGITKDPTIPGCAIAQPDFATQQANGNLSFRIPLQLFGLGLIDSIQDREIMSHFNATASQRAALGIAGHPNRNGNDGTITRFGWKAQKQVHHRVRRRGLQCRDGHHQRALPDRDGRGPGLHGPEQAGAERRRSHGHQRQPKCGVQQPAPHPARLDAIPIDDALH